ncbi:MAG TPA: DUF6665 family protein [Kofleriaceae bacterium]|nr:DUF6665 family protein [Kofleriaceae bacterium]
MADKDAIGAIEYQLEEGRAFALGQAGRRVEAAIAALERGGADRELLLTQAAEAVWAFLIVREAAGFRNAKAVFEAYRVPPAVIARIGIVRR